MNGYTSSIGVMVPHLGVSQLSYYLVKNLNEACRGDFSPIVFYEELARPPIKPHFCTLQAIEANLFKAPIIATSFRAASRLKALPQCHRRYFYIWDLEWADHSVLRADYNTLYGVYGDGSYELIARSESHKRIIENCWNRPVAGVVDDFNVSQLMEIVNGSQKGRTDDGVTSC